MREYDNYVKNLLFQVPRVREMVICLHDFYIIKTGQLRGTSQSGEDLIEHRI